MNSIEENKVEYWKKKENEPMTETEPTKESIKLIYYIFSYGYIQKKLGWSSIQFGINWIIRKNNDKGINVNGTSGQILLVII